MGELLKLAEPSEFATAESTRQRKGESDIAWADRTFCPSFPGVHICGADHEENRFFTIADWPTRTDAEAMRLWLTLRQEFSVAGEDGDFVVDYNSFDGHEDEFSSTRQLLPAMWSALRALAATKDQTDA